MKISQQAWWDLEDARTLGKELQGVVTRLETDQRWRRSDALRRYSTFFGHLISSFKAIDTSGLWLVPSDKHDLPDQDMSFVRTAVNTCTARIAAKQRPKPVVLTSGADYKTRLQARKLSKFLEGQFQESQGSYSTIWDLGLQLFWDSAVTDGVAKVVPDLALKKVAVKRLHVWNLFFDEADAKLGEPTQIYEREVLDRSAAIAAYPEHEEALSNAPTVTDEDAKYGSADKRSIVLWHAYKKPSCKEDKGRKVVLCGDHVVCDEDWPHDNFPYSFLFWHRSPIGVSGLPPTEFARRPQLTANYLFNQCLENTVALSGGYIDVERGAYGDAQITSNLSVKVMERNVGSAPAQIVMPKPFNTDVWNQAQFYKEQVFEVFGVSQASVQGTIEPGVNSGVAIRNRTDLQDMQFLVQARSLEQWFIDLGKLMVQATQDLVKAGVKPESFLPSQGGFIESIDWSGISLGENDLYTVQVRSGSDLSDTYAARLQFVSELQANGALDAASAQRLLLSGNPDLESYNNRKSAQWNWVERIICEILDSDEDEAQDVEGPDPLMSLPEAMTQMVDAYLELSSWPKAPEWRRRAMRNWVLACAELIQRGQAPSGAPAMPGAMPGMPPMPPGGELPPGPPPQMGPM